MMMEPCRIIAEIDERIETLTEQALNPDRAQWLRESALHRRHELDDLKKFILTSGTNR